MADALKVPRRTLDRRFRDSGLGRTIYEELTRAHVERARSLLAETDLPLVEVAAESGFADQQMLSVVFKKTTGSTPGAWRRAAAEVRGGRIHYEEHEGELVGCMLR